MVQKQLANLGGVAIMQRMEEFVEGMAQRKFANIYGAPTMSRMVEFVVVMVVKRPNNES